MDLDEAKQKIRDEVKFVDIKPYSHNIIGLLLLSVSKDYGRKQANELIDEFELEDMGWKKVNE